MLQALQIQAGPDSKSNDVIQGFDLAAKFRMDVVLLDRADKHYIVLHYDRDGQQLSYLQRQASFLRLWDGARDSTSEADLVALLCLVFTKTGIRSHDARRSSQPSCFATFATVK